MESWRYLVLVAACITASYTSDIQNVTISEPPEYLCYDARENCTSVHLSEYTTINSYLEVQLLLESENRLFQFSTALDDAADCEERVYESEICANVNSETTYNRVMAEFLAVPGAIETIAAFSSSECVLDENRHEKVGQAASSCSFYVQEAQFTGSDLCVAIDEFVQCFKEHLRPICGSDAVDLVQMVWDFARAPGHESYLSFVLPFGDVTCEQQVQVARRFVKHVLPLWQKLRK